MDTILVTGAAGFLGSHLCRAFLARGHRVVALDDLSGGFRRNLPAHERLVFVAGSILDERLLARLFEEHRFDYVCHLAAFAAEVLSHFIKRFNYRNNLMGSIHLIHLAIVHEVRCFLYTSSAAVYGETAAPAREDAVPLPIDSYGVAKLAVEQELRVSALRFGLRSVIFRPHNVYGEHQHIGDRYRNVIGIFINQAMRGEPLGIFGDGSQTRAFSYVGDILQPLVECLHREAMHGEVYNLGADRQVSLRELARTVLEAFGGEGSVRLLPARHEAPQVCLDHAKIRALFPGLPQTPLDEGVRRMVQWARAIGPQEPTRFGAIEIERGLPEVWRER